MIGPVQEKETKQIENAPKKVPINPPLSEADSALLAQEEGRDISKYPKKEMAKTVNKTKKVKFISQCVDSRLSELAPKVAVISKPKLT